MTTKARSSAPDQPIWDSQSGSFVLSQRQEMERASSLFDPDEERLRLCAAARVERAESLRRAVV